VIFADEAGFYLLPAAVRTWAPSGETPVLKAPLRWNHLSVIGGVSENGKLHQQVYEHSRSAARDQQPRGHPFSEAPAQLHRRKNDCGMGRFAGAPFQKGETVFRRRSRAAYPLGTLARLRAGPESQRRYLESSQIRGLKNLCCGHLDRLKTELRRAKERLRHKTEVIKMPTKS